jgi:hypothetical protein
VSDGVEYDVLVASCSANTRDRSATRSLSLTKVTGHVFRCHRCINSGGTWGEVAPSGRSQLLTSALTFRLFPFQIPRGRAGPAQDTQTVLSARHSRTPAPLSSPPFSWTRSVEIVQFLGHLAATAGSDKAAKMYTPGGHRTSLLTPRVTELLESLKVEFETVQHDANMFKMQRDDYERKRTPLHFANLRGSKNNKMDIIMTKINASSCVCSTSTTGGARKSATDTLRSRKKPHQSQANVRSIGGRSLFIY